MLKNCIAIPLILLTTFAISTIEPQDSMADGHADELKEEHHEIKELKIQSSDEKNGRVVKLVSIHDFKQSQSKAKNESETIWYIDKERQSLAVDAEQFKDQFAQVDTT